MPVPVSLAGHPSPHLHIVHTHMYFTCIQLCTSVYSEHTIYCTPSQQLTVNYSSLWLVSLHQQSIHLSLRGEVRPPSPNHRQTDGKKYSRLQLHPTPIITSDFVVVKIVHWLDIRHIVSIAELELLLRNSGDTFSAIFLFSFPPVRYIQQENGSKVNSSL